MTSMNSVVNSIYRAWNKKVAFVLHQSAPLLIFWVLSQSKFVNCKIVKETLVVMFELFANWFFIFFYEFKRYCLWNTSRRFLICSKNQNTVCIGIPSYSMDWNQWITSINVLIMTLKEKLKKSRILCNFELTMYWGQWITSI